MIRVFVADDHAVVRHGLRMLIDAQHDMRVVGEADNGRKVLIAAETEAWDVLVLDLSLPRVHGTEVLRRLHASRPTLAIVVLSMYPDSQFAERVKADGAAAYVGKDQPATEVIAAIRRTVDPAPRRAPPQEPIGPVWPHDRLSARELQVFMLITQGRAPGEIAAELNIVPSTVSNHLTAIKEKLDARSLADILAYAHRAGLVT